MKKHKEVKVMNAEQQFLYLGTDYKIISAEQEFIFHPAVLEQAPITAEALKRTFSCKFYIENYRLMLNCVTLYEGGISSDNQELQTSNPIDQKLEGLENNDIHDLKLAYHGTVLIGAEITKDFKWDGNQTACFSYKNVYELIFEDGILITTIDHSKDMLRIRKNIELGYRSITSKHDIRLIKHFLNSSFVGDYKPFSRTWKRLKYLRKMKTNYTVENL